MSNRIPSRSMALALVVVAGTLVGCDREPESAKTLREQGHKIAVLGTGGSAGPTEAQAKVFKETTSKLGALGTGKIAAAGQTLVSSAHTGLADDPIEQMQVAERAALAKSDEVLAQAAMWSGTSSVASVAEAYDPSADLVDAAKSKEEKNRLAEDARKRLAGVEQQIAGLRAQIASKDGAAQVKLREYNEALARTAPMKAKEALPIVESANKAKREADALRLEAGKIEAQLDVTTPVANELRLIVEQAVNQAKSLDDRAAELNARKAANAKVAVNAREEAGKSREQIKRLMGELESLRSGDVEAKGSAALSALSQGVKAAQAATSETPAGAKLALGTAKQKVGDVHAVRARGFQSYAALLKSMSKVEPKLPDAADYATKAEAALKAAEEAAGNARTAYGEAASAFGSAQVGPEAKQRLQALVTKLQAMSKSAEEAAADAAAAAATQAAAQPATPAPSAPAAAAPGGPEAEVLAAVEKYLEAGKNERFEDLGAMIYAPTPDARRVIDAMIAMGGKMARLDKACKAKFGKGFAEAAAGMGGGAMGGSASIAGMDFEKIKTLSAKDFTVAVQGETATASQASMPKPLQFRKTEQGWMLEVAELNNPMMAQAVAMMAPMSAAIDELIGDVEAGKHADVASVMQALMQKMMGGMKPPGGPGGG